MMLHVVAYISFFALVAVLYFVRPRWTYFSVIPLSILVGLVTVGLPFRNFIEGGFGFLNEMLTVAMGAIFIAVLVETEALVVLMAGWSRLSRGKSYISLVGIMALGLVPGMFTGSAILSYAVLDRLMVPILRTMGLPSHRAKVIALLTSSLGMMAPPVNIMLLLLNGTNWGSVLGVGPFLWLVIAPGLLLTAALFTLLSRKELKAGTNSVSRKILSGDFLGIGTVLLISVLRFTFPETFLGHLGTPLVLACGALVAWFAAPTPIAVPRKSFFTITNEGIASASQLLLLFVASSLVLQVSQYTGLANVVGGFSGLATKLPAILSIGLLVVVGLVLASCWEGLGALVIVPLYAANTFLAYYSAVVTASAIFTMMASATLSLGILIPLGWKNKIFGGGTFEKGMGSQAVLAGAILFGWIMIVYLVLGPMAGLEGILADAAGSIGLQRGVLTC